MGGVVGPALAFRGVAAVRSLAPAGLPRVATVGVSAPAMLFNFGLRQTSMQDAVRFRHRVALHQDLQQLRMIDRLG